MTGRLNPSAEVRLVGVAVKVHSWWNRQIAYIKYDPYLCHFKCQVSSYFVHRVDPHKFDRGPETPMFFKNYLKMVY